MTQPQPSKYFFPYTWKPQQRMVQDWIDTAIKRSGLFIQYLPRENVQRDPLYGEDPWTRFEDAVTIEVYVKNTETFGGAGDIMAKFGFVIADSVTFTISRRRWNQIRTEKMVMENDSIYQNEITDNDLITDTNSFLLEAGNAEGYSITFEKPRAGDLIYFPLVRKVFEITHVEHENIFYQHGALMTYDLKCELFKYSSEEFRTGKSEIDVIEDLYNADMRRDLIIKE